MKGRRSIVVPLLVAAGFAVSSPTIAAEDASFASPDHFVSNDGAFLYRAICQGCHMPDGRGARGAATYPALAGNPKLASPLYPAIMVMKGLRAMPGFSSMLDDAQVAAVVNYVRANFGNQYSDLLDANAVRELRQ